MALGSCATHLRSEKGGGRDTKEHCDALQIRASKRPYVHGNMSQHVKASILGSEGPHHVGCCHGRARHGPMGASRQRAEDFLPRGRQVNVHRAPVAEPAELVVRIGRRHAHLHVSWS
eukprot:scaffold223786_cov37-Prasinocladus_malaysianus.AAC.2